MIYHLHHLLAASARQHPHGVAVVYGDDRLEYAQFDEASGRLARALLDHGMRRADRVGIFLPKSLEAAVSIFGILKAGGVYVPIDPNSPPSRAAHIVRDCGIKHLITTGRGLRALFEGPGDRGGPLEAVVLAGDQAGPDRVPPGVRIVPWRDLSGFPVLRRDTEGVDTDLAYILYTSGSTGVPKGVMISHRAAFTFIDWTYHHLGVNDTDIVANHAPLHFDLSIFDIFTTIKAGGTVALVPERLSTFPIVLSQFIRDNRITIWYSVPSALTLLLAHGTFARYTYPHLRLVLFAGEVFPIKYLRMLTSATTARLLNLYGPTETNVCTFYEVRDLASDRTAPVPIGKAIENYEVFALTEDQRLIRPGEVGELYARGPGLMSGYWGDPQRTAQVLLQNMLHPHFEERVCRTGDLVTLDEEGNYLYIGRRDHMVKSRGYRIELGEIETALYSHPRITEAVVVAIPDEEVTNRLKAFIVTDPADALTVQDVQGYCQEHVPKYMVPETVEFRRILPKTSTGKVDRRSLLEESLTVTRGEQPRSAL
ncbi:MAG: amino acid adenylation domain-containing protein [bacterium]